MIMTADGAMVGLAIARHCLARGGIASDDIAGQLTHCLAHRDEALALLTACAQDAFRERGEPRCDRWRRCKRPGYRRLLKE
jgi:hypothetical protein